MWLSGVRRNKTTRRYEVTRYSRDDAKELIRDAASVIEAVKAVAYALNELAQLRQDTSSEAARLHAELDRHLAWFTARHLRIDGLDPVSVAVPSRLVRDDSALDVWLSWRDGDDTLDFYYLPDETVDARMPLPTL